MLPRLFCWARWWSSSPNSWFSDEFSHSALPWLTTSQILDRTVRHNKAIERCPTANTSFSTAPRKGCTIAAVGSLNLSYWNVLSDGYPSASLLSPCRISETPPEWPSEMCRAVPCSSFICRLFETQGTERVGVHIGGGSIVTPLSHPPMVTSQTFLGASTWDFRGSLHFLPWPFEGVIKACFKLHQSSSDWMVTLRRESPQGCPKVMAIPQPFLAL